MKTKAGLWIDHQMAVIVKFSETGDQILQIHSKAERQRRRAYEPTAGPFPAFEVPADDAREREYQRELLGYYDEVIAQLRAVDEVLIFGPGEAKGEFEKQLAKDKSGSRSLTLETADKMTVPQIAAHVRHHFHLAPPRVKAVNFHRPQTLNQG